MKFDLLNVCLLAGIPLCAAFASAITKHLSGYPLGKVVTHPLFVLLLVLGGYEFFAARYLYRPGVLHQDGAPISIVEPVIVISTVLIAVLLGIGLWEEKINLAQAFSMIAILPLLFVALTGRIPRL